MNLVTGGRFIGRKSGQGKNGTWYQLSFQSDDDDTLTMRCTDKAYMQCAALSMGDDIHINLSLRLYQRDWIPRIETINE